MSAGLHLVGVGPGDPELLTLKAARVIASADVIAYPQKPGEAPRAFDIARAHLGAHARRLPVEIAMAVDPAPARAAYDACAEALAGHVRKGRTVVYLCEGDPLFYGSAMYLLERLRGQIPVAVVPGVTALTAAAAVALRPLASRNDILKVLPAPLADGRLEAELATAAVAAIIKVGRHFDRVRALLDRIGLAQTAIVVEYATGASQSVTPLPGIAAGKRPYFSTILVGDGRGTDR